MPANPTLSGSGSGSDRYILVSARHTAEPRGFLSPVENWPYSKFAKTDQHEIEQWTDAMCSSVFGRLH